MDKSSRGTSRIVTTSFEMSKDVEIEEEAKLNQNRRTTSPLAKDMGCRGV
jgi:hypothetical protein